MQHDVEGYTQLAFEPRAGDEKLYVHFKMQPVLNQARSIEEGRNIYEDKEFVSIHVPGSRDEVLREAQPQDKVRFRRQYDNFKAGQADAVVGTPLALLPGITPSQVEEFAFFKVKTVEALAEMNDGVAVRFPGINDLKRRAKVYLEAAAGAAPALKLQAELEARDGEIEALKQQLADLAAEVRKAPKK